MARRSLRRCTTAIFVVLSLLFSQLALAGYVCPGASDSPGSMADMMASGEPCEGMDMAQPVLCFQHAADLSLSFEPVKLTTPSLPAIVQLVVMPWCWCRKAMSFRRRPCRSGSIRRPIPFFSPRADCASDISVD